MLSIIYNIPFITICIVSGIYLNKDKSVICNKLVNISSLCVSIIKHKYNNSKRHIPDKISKNKYKLTYYLNNKEYIIFINKKPGPNPIIQIIADNEDKTSIISKILGPDLNFHNTPGCTPELLGFKSLTFNMTDGSTLEFKDKEPIKIS